MQAAIVMQRRAAWIPVSARAGYLVAILSIGLAGCSGAPENVARVSGRVTLQGQPLAKSLVTFQPLAPEGGTSYARTDANGMYTLMYTPEILGAEIGEHTVRISSEMYEIDTVPMTPAVPERVPAKYNTQTELKREVKPGKNTIDFEL